MFTLLVCTRPHSCFPLVFPPALICIHPRPLVFLPAVVRARSYPPIPTYCPGAFLVVQSMGCVHSFGCTLARFSWVPSFVPVCHPRSFAVYPCPRLVSVYRLHPSLPTGHAHPWLSNPSAACIHLGVPLYVPVPTFILARYCSYPLSFAPVPTYCLCALSFICARAQHPCPCVPAPAVVG